VARRIVAHVRPGDIVVAGQRIGLIRFGSRVDVYLPAGTLPRVLSGQRTVAGETIIAEIGDSVRRIGFGQ
jgi:phosphatidylserine decarboxylase